MPVLKRGGIRLSFYGGVGEVTGSRHLLEADGLSLLMDCGLFQGHRHEAIRKNGEIPFDPKALQGVVLSHAHIDHCGALPLLAKRGLNSPIHCTRPTQEICSVMLMDSAHLQEEDAKFFNKIHAQGPERIEPLYIQEDAQRCLELFKPHLYREPFELHEGIRVRLLNAGHVLGSAMLEFDISSSQGARRILFTGDLGRRSALLINPPDMPRDVDYLVIESTYGARTHDSLDLVGQRLTDVVLRAVQEEGKVLIPSFALERTQEIAFVLHKLRRENKIPAVPIYVDSPMAVGITDIFKKNIETLSFQPEFRQSVLNEKDPFGFETLHYVHSIEESKDLNSRPGPSIIISASGMCEGGRILHHLRNNIADERTTVLIVGYQAEGTLGRRLLDGAKKVRIFGLEHEVWARVEAIDSFSAHADREDLLWFIRSLKPRPRKIFLVHGSPQNRTALLERLKAEGLDRVACPEYADAFDLE